MDNTIHTEKSGAWVASTLDKNERKEAIAFRLGFLAGIQNIVPRKIAEKREYLAKMRETIMKRKSEAYILNNDIKERMQAHEMRVKYAGKFAVYRNIVNSEYVWLVIPAKECKTTWGGEIAYHYKVFDSVQKANLYAHLMNEKQISHYAKQRFAEYRKREMTFGKFVVIRDTYGDNSYTVRNAYEFARWRQNVLVFGEMYGKSMPVWTNKENAQRYANAKNMRQQLQIAWGLYLRKELRAITHAKRELLIAELKEAEIVQKPLIENLVETKVFNPKRDEIYAKLSMLPAFY
jgi:hypothetical protein